MKSLILCLLFFSPLTALSLKNEKGELKKEAKALMELYDVESSLSTSQVIPSLLKQWWQKGNEYWEMDQNVDERLNKAIPLLQKLGFLDSISPKEKQYDYALVLGATGRVMQRRLDYLYKQWVGGVKIGHIYLLGGDRPLNPKLEQIPLGIQNEAELFEHLYQNHPLHTLVPYTLIDSPKIPLSNGTFRRPDTGITVRDFLKTQPVSGSCLAISSQPFVGYQEAVVRLYLPKTYSVEGIGPGKASALANAKEDIPNLDAIYPISIYLDLFAKWLTFQHFTETK